MKVRARVLFVGVSIALVATLAVFAGAAVEATGKGAVRLVGMFGQVVALIRSSYVEEVAVDRLQVGALAGLVEAADPGGEWVPEEGVAAYAAVRTRELPPFGMVLGKRASYPFVLQVLPGSAAERAGITAGELIEQIGEEPVRARPLWRAQVLLDEAERRGGALNLDIIDRQFDGKRRVSVSGPAGTRPAATVEDRAGVPVIRLPMVADEAVMQLTGLLRPFGASEAVIVDLRGAALGKPQAAASVAAALAGGNVELPLQRREGKGAMLRASGPARSWRIIALIDPTTAGAAEMVAMALKERGATLIGTDSYGDTGQRRSFAASGGQLWLAQEWAQGPDGKPLLGSGLKPDEQVRSRRLADPVLDRALEIARGAALRQAA